MGQTLSEPITEKATEQGADNRLAYGVSSMQGWRMTMEDAHAAVLKLTSPTDDRHISFFAVYDGHGAANVAKHSAIHLHSEISALSLFADSKFEEALKTGFLNMDVSLRKNSEMQSSGCTAVSCLFTHDNRVFCANAGDSRAIICSLGKAIPLSFDHKPTNPEELARIKAAGGFVEFGRVNGDLALSRALGDFMFKTSKDLPATEQMVTAYPDVTERVLESGDEFVVLACDGIWDVLTNQQVADFVCAKLLNELTLPEICEAMMDHCMSAVGDLSNVGSDNMTVCIVALKNGKSYEEWATKVRNRIYSTGGVTVDHRDTYTPRQKIEKPL